MMNCNQFLIFLYLLKIADLKIQDPKIDQFFDWARSEGAEFDNFEVLDLENGSRGVFAKKDISKDSLIVSVPNNLIITVEKAL